MEIGTRLGPYEVQEKLGAGGMGEVYLAQDTRLGRKVAIKVLPEEFAGDPERLARFEQEARAAAALNHPHIAAVFDVGAETGADGASVHYMVQEFLDGDSLRAVLERGRMPLPRALELGTEITEALGAAHRAGIVHRDLKPDNVFVTGDGHAKVLDFGLAKLTEVAGGAAGDQSMSPTILGTQAGAIMGTAGYMAPEQVNAQEVDARADLFAFGCLLYEMASGKRAFAGQSLVQTLNRIAHEEPAPLHSMDGSLPVELQRIVRKCLAKSPARRYQTAGDLTVDLLNLGADVEAGRAEPGAATAGPGTPAPSTPAWKTVLPVALATLLLGAAASWLLRPAPPEPIVGRFEVPYPADTRRALGVSRGLTISPDGKRLAFEANRTLWLRGTADFEATVVRGTEDSSPRNPTFSPDSQNLAFWSQGQLKRVPVGGGAPVTLANLPADAVGTDWADDGYIYVAQRDGDIHRVAENGGMPALAIESDEETGSPASPQLLPGGEWMLVTAGRGSGGQVLAVSLRSGERRSLVQASDALYVPTGHLLFAVGGDLLAQPFDVRTLELYGGPAVVVEDVASSAYGLNLAVSNRGDLVYRPGGEVSSNSLLLTWVGRDGTLEPLPFPPQDYDWARVSPDGRRIAVEQRDGGIDIWVYDIDTAGVQRLTSSGGNHRPVWSPDSEWIYFAEDDGQDIWKRRADLSSPAERVLEMEGLQYPESISADGRLLSFGNDEDIYLLELDGNAEPRAGVATEAREVNSQLSPDGRFIVYTSYESGEARIYVREIASNRQWPISPGRGEGLYPKWTPDGEEILYRQRSGDVMSVQITYEPEFDAAAPREVVRLPAAPRGIFTLDAEGERLLFYSAPGAPDTGTETESNERLLLVLNWFEELKQRVSVER